MRFLLAFFFFLMYAGDNFGINISLAPGLSIKNLLLYAIIAGIVINTAVARNRKIELPSVLVTWVFLLMYAIITWITASYIIAYPGYDAFQSFVKLKFLMIDQFLTFVAFFYGVVYFKDAFSLLRMIVWIAIIGNLVTMIDTFNIPNLGIVEASQAVGEEGRIQGFLGQPNLYGQFLVIFLPVSIAVYLAESGKVRVLAALCVVSTAFALILTGSRGAYLGSAGGAILATFYLRQFFSTRLLIRAGFIAASVFALAVLVSLTAGYSDIIADRFSRFSGDAHVATSGRSTIWARAISLMLEHPVSFITGYGFSVYENASNVRMAAHNMYLNYLYNLGSIGLILFVTIFIRILATARSAIEFAGTAFRPYFVACVFGLIGLLVTLFFAEYHALGYLIFAYLGVVMRMAMELKSTAGPELVQQ